MQGVQLGNDDQLDASLIEHGQHVRWWDKVSKDTMDLCDMSAAYRSAAAELGVIKYEKLLAAMASQVAAHSYLVITEVKQTTVVCNTAHAVDTEIDRKAREKSVCLTGDHIAIQTAQPAARDRDLARVITA